MITLLDNIQPIMGNISPFLHTKKKHTMLASSSALDTHSLTNNHSVQLIQGSFLALLLPSEETSEKAEFKSYTYCGHPIFSD